MSAVEKAKTEFLEFSEIVRVFVSRPNLFKLFMDSAWNLINANEQAVNARLAAMTQERDDIQLRLHAIDHAYNEQQRSPLLMDTLKHNKELMELVVRQRKFIKTLYTSRKARKGKGSTSAQSDRENVPKSNSGGNAGVKTDYFTEGFENAGTKACPYPINTIERLHWMDGARDRFK